MSIDSEETWKVNLAIHLLTYRSTDLAIRVNKVCTVVVPQAPECVVDFSTGMPTVKAGTDGIDAKFGV